METESFAEEFTAAMDCRGLWLGTGAGEATGLVEDPQAAAGYRRWLRRRRLCDGGAVRRLEAAVLEKPPVERISTRAIAKRGFTDRVGVVPGDMLDEPLPGGYRCPSVLQRAARLGRACRRTAAAGVGGGAGARRAASSSTTPS